MTWFHTVNVLELWVGLLLEKDYRNNKAETVVVTKLGQWQSVECDFMSRQLDKSLCLFYHFCKWKQHL